MPKSLRIQRDAVALEAFSGRDVSAYFKDIFPQIASSFADFTTRFSPSQKGLVFSPEYRKFQSELPKHTFLDIAPLTAFVPEGLNVTYLEYADRLIDAVTHASKIMDVMAPYSVYLSRLITNADAALSTPSHEIEFKMLQRERDEINEDLGDCFKKGSAKTEANLGTVVRRNADWNDVFERCTIITDTLNKVDRTVILKKVAECSNHLAIILKMLKEQNMEKVANATVMHLADGAYQVASELEFYAVAYFKAEVFVTCVNKTIEHFKKVMDTTKNPK